MKIVGNMNHGGKSYATQTNYHPILEVEQLHNAETDIFHSLVPEVIVISSNIRHESIVQNAAWPKPKIIHS